MRQKESRKEYYVRNFLNQLLYFKTMYWIFNLSFFITVFLLFLAIKKIGVRNNSSHPNKWTPATTHQEHSLCDVPFSRGSSPHSLTTYFLSQLKSFEINNLCFFSDWKWGECVDLSSNYYWAPQTVPPSNLARGENVPTVFQFGNLQFFFFCMRTVGQW